VIVQNQGVMRPHDAADVLVAVEHVVVVIRPLAARAAFGGAFESQYVVSVSSAHAVGAHVVEVMGNRR
jgi:hypothetical protein